MYNDGSNDDIVPRNDEPQLISTFYDQHDNKPINYVACAPLGSSSFLILPHEFDRINDFELNKNTDYTRDFPCIYNSVSNQTIKLSESCAPLGRKVLPFAVIIGIKVYVLSCRHIVQPVIPKPSFEAYDIVNKEWETMEPPPFSNDVGYDSRYKCIRGWYTEEYAAFENFIIVCFLNAMAPNQSSRHAIFSYNTLSNEWKNVKYHTPQVIRNYDGNDDSDHDDGESEFRIWNEEVVVINGYIYAYLMNLGQLVWYACTNTLGDEGELSLGKRIVVERYEDRDWDNLNDDFNMESGALGRIGKDMICIVKTNKK